MYMEFFKKYITKKRLVLLLLIIGLLSYSVLIGSSTNREDNKKVELKLESSSTEQQIIKTASLKLLLYRQPIEREIFIENGKELKKRKHNEPPYKKAFLVLTTGSTLVICIFFKIRTQRFSNIGERVIGQISNFTFLNQKYFELGFIDRHTNCIS